MKECVFYSILSFLCGVICTYIFAIVKINTAKKEKESANFELVKLQTKLENFDNMTEVFKQLATQTMEQTNNTLLEKNQTLLAPLKEDLKEFKEKVDLLKNTGIENTSALKEKIDTLRKDSLNLQMQAQALTDSLKLNSKHRGIFGELVLEQILTSSGLINKNDDEILGNYITQKGVKDANNPEARALIPDAIVFFPEMQKHIIIDSKCPLNYFQEFIKSGEDENLQEFYKAVASMIDELSEKYNAPEGLSTPDFKILFIPMETAYLYLYENSELILHANQKNIVLAGPSTLVAILKIVKECWDTKNISNNLSEMQNIGNALYETFCTFINRLENLNGKFLSLNTAFQDTFTTIKGQKGLIKQFEKFKKMGLNPNKQLDEKYLIDYEEEESHV